MVDRVELRPVAGPEIRVGRQVVDPAPPGERRDHRAAVADVGPDHLDPLPADGSLSAPGRSTTRTRAPRTISCSTNWLPMNPAPPVTIVRAAMPSL